MAVTERTKRHIIDSYCAHFIKLTASTGLDGWLTWLKSDSVDDYCVNEAMRRIIEERMESGRFGNRDILKLTEMQAVYFKVKREQDYKKEESKVKDGCDFCDDNGFRWVVVHSFGTTKSETMITKVPEDTSAIRPWCYHYTIPCTCPRGERLYNQRKATLEKEGRLRVAIDPRRLQDVLTRLSMKYDDAWHLVMDYMKLIRIKFHPKREETDEDKERSRTFNLIMQKGRRKIAELEGVSQEQEQPEPSVPF